MKTLMSVILCGIVMLSCNTENKTEPVKLPQKEESKILMEVDRQWAKANGPEEFLSFLDKNAIMMTPDKPIIRGHNEIQKLLAEFQSLPGFEITWEPQEAYVSSSGDLGYTVDRIQVAFDGENSEKVKLFEKGITIWKKDANNHWKLAVDIWNIDPSIKSIYK